jgi:purine-binding chemotaxis protein CheW
MDFLEIRRKAKERAARAAAEVIPAPASTPEPAVNPPPAAGARPEGEAQPKAGRAARRPTPPPTATPAPPAAVGPPGPPTPGREPAREPEATREEAGPGDSRRSALPHAADSRFVTWRPDGGGPPDLAAVHPSEPLRSMPAPVPVAPPEPLDALEEFFYREDEPAPELGLVPSPASGELVVPVALEEYLILRLGGERYGVEIGRVLEVMRTPAITEVPRAPSDVRGVIAVRGDLVTVVDPRSRLGLARSEGPPARRVVIVDDGEGAFGLLVEGVAGVVRLPRGALEPCPQALGGAGGALYLGIGRDVDRLFLVLDLRALLRPLRGTAEARPA